MGLTRPFKASAVKLDDRRSRRVRRSFLARAAHLAGTFPPQPTTLRKAYTGVG